MPEGITMFLGILALSFLFVNKVNSQCSSSTLNLTVGMTAVEISSPGYPNGYANNVTCGWNLTMEGPTEFAMFALHFTEISLNCTNDTLTVNDVAVCLKTPDELMLVNKPAAVITFASSSFGQTLKGFRVNIVKAYSYERNGIQCYEIQVATYEVKYFSTLMIERSCYVGIEHTQNTTIAIDIVALDLREGAYLEVSNGERWLRFQNITSLEQRYIYSSKGGDAVIYYKYYPGMGKGSFLSYRLVDEIPETSTVDQQTLQFSTGDTQPKLSTVDQQTLQFTTGDTQPKLSTVDQQTLQFSSGDAQPELSTVIMDQQTMQFSTGGVMTNQLVTLVVPLNFLEGYVGLQQSFGSVFVCSQLCKQIKSCKSINYAKTKQICHINNQRSNTTNAMKRVQGFIYKDVTDMHEALARSCRTNPCSLSEMCVPGPNNEIKCIPLANIGYSTKPNKCQEIECISINGGYTEYNITDVGNGRVVSMTELSYSSFCGVSDGNVYYGWKRSSVFVDGGCSGTFKVCFTLV